ncbi:hypothetical protein FACS1894105_12120 [Clostridia bacterium]|nr:hypothetical protein FACS1894105_12120 [Clostridia bacterium]
MTQGLQPVIDYLQTTATDPFPRYILKNEILRESITDSDITAIHSSKWYKQLAYEQWEDGSWGRFHTQDTKSPIKQKFVVTKIALRRAHELGLTKDDTMIARCIKIMERYISGEETWTDNIEKHHDNGKSHMRSRLFLTAANINLFDHDNPVIKPLREIVINTLKVAFASGNFDQEAWAREDLSYRGPCIREFTAYPFMLLRNSDCLDDELQSLYLSYIWNKEDGIYYVSNLPPAQIQYAEDKKFDMWIRTLELLSGFSLFPEFMRDEVLGHLLGEANRIMNGDVVLPSAHPIFGHYAESWRDKTARKNDMLLRILRVLVKAI